MDKVLPNGSYACVVRLYKFWSQYASKSCEEWNLDSHWNPSLSCAILTPALY